MGGIKAYFVESTRGQLQKYWKLNLKGRLAHYYYPKSTYENKRKVKSTVTHIGTFHITHRMKVRFKLLV